MILGSQFVISWLTFANAMGVVALVAAWHRMPRGRFRVAVIAEVVAVIAYINLSQLAFVEGLRFETRFSIAYSVFPVVSGVLLALVFVARTLEESLQHFSNKMFRLGAVAAGASLIMSIYPGMVVDLDVTEGTMQPIYSYMMDAYLVCLAIAGITGFWMFRRTKNFAKETNQRVMFYQARLFLRWVGILALLMIISNGVVPRIVGSKLSPITANFALAYVGTLVFVFHVTEVRLLKIRLKMIFEDLLAISPLNAAPVAQAASVFERLADGQVVEGMNWLRFYDSDGRQQRSEVALGHNEALADAHEMADYVQRLEEQASRLTEHAAIEGVKEYEFMTARLHREKALRQANGLQLELSKSAPDGGAVSPQSNPLRPEELAEVLNLASQVTAEEIQALLQAHGVSNQQNHD